ncbi:MAG: UvrD-helicase domain-containing protein [Clostridia bacterium]
MIEVDKKAKPSRWTDEQWQAIKLSGNNLLVAAAAGSGKTSVLVERIIRKMTDSPEPIGVDQLLVVTFTNAAAAEMRHRIGDALRTALAANPQSAYLRRQLAYLQRASITTIHKFCLGLLRQHYYAVDLDPDFRIGDEMETELLRQDVLEEKLEEWYEHDEAFCRLADTIVDGQDDAKLVSLIFSLYHFSQSHPRPQQWLDEAAAMFARASTQSIDEMVWTKSIVQYIASELISLAETAQKALEWAASPEGPNAYQGLLEQERDALRAAADAARDGWEALETAVRSIAFQKLPNVKEADPDLKKLVQKLRGKVKDGVKGLLEEYFATSPDAYRTALAETAPYMETLVRIVGEFADAYQSAKRLRTIVDFNDLEHLALAILSKVEEDGSITPSAVAKGLREQFAEVLVDEYQDINLVQETILRLVSRDAAEDGVSNRFMVGDVKQSIYRFRLAEPGLFMHKYDSYPKYTEGDGQGEGIRIDLAANFRSRKEVVDAVNYIFRQVMSPGVGELDYDRSAELVYAARDYAEIEPERLAVEVHLIDRTAPEAEEERDEASESATAETTSLSDENGAMPGAAEENPVEEASVAQLEARLIAKRIRQWMEPGEGEKPLLVFDKETKGLRPLAYRDIVILLRATSSWAQPMREELRAAGIPIYVEQSDGYFEATEVDLMLSLLKLIDNPLQDIPLAAVLRSPLVGLKEEELAEIRIKQSGGPFHLAVLQVVQDDSRAAWKARLAAFFHQLEEWRTAARRGSLAELLTQIYRETGYQDYVATLENGQQRQANLRLLYDRARQYEATSYRGLFRFLRFVERLRQSGSDLGEARTIGEAEDVVRIMTIHKSKGLEFPVVFVAGLGKQFNQMDMLKPFLLHKELGFGPQVTDMELRLKYPSLAQLGIKHRLKREMLAEEMRVLYVALTRAREKLVLVGSSKKLADRIGAWCDASGEHERLGDGELLKAKGYLDWIGSSLIRHPLASPLRSYSGAGEQVRRTIPDDSRWVFVFQQASVLERQEGAESPQLALWERMVARQPLDDQPVDEYWREYIDRQLSWKDPYAIASTTRSKWSVSELKRAASKESRSIQLPKITQAPRFLAAESTHRFTAAERGTILHTVMQQLDLTRTLDAEDLARQVSAMVDRQFLTVEAAKQVDMQRIVGFFQSELGTRLRHAKQVYREVPFTMALHGHEVSPELTSELGKQVIVQGVIDCMFEESDGKLIMLDFKTDAFWGDSSEQAAADITNRYREQIRRYEQAVSRIWRRSVNESWLYLFGGNVAVQVKGEGH